MGLNIPRNDVLTPEQAFDEMFGVGQNVPTKDNEIQKIKLDLLIDYPKQRYSILPLEEMQEMSDDIKAEGVLEPAVVRPHPTEKGKYELLAGRNRKRASAMAGLDFLPCIVKQANDAQAKLIVNSTNLKRRKILLPSEKAYGYKQELEALTELGTNCPTISQIAKANNTNRKEIYRYIQLAKLDDDLLDFVDEERIPVIAGVELSYINEGNQKRLAEFLKTHKKIKVTIAVAEDLRALEIEKDFYADYLEEFFNPKKGKAKPMKITISKLQYVLPVELNKKEVENYLIEAVTFYKEHKK